MIGIGFYVGRYICDPLGVFIILSSVFTYPMLIGLCLDKYPRSIIAIFIFISLVVSDIIWFKEDFEYRQLKLRGKTHEYKGPNNRFFNPQKYEEYLKLKKSRKEE